MIYPKVSVIIPTYKRADLLPRAINSVLNQTFKDFELIIVDDCSPDNTPEIVKEFQKKDERVKYIRLDKNSGGPARPTNIGIKNSKGEYIAILENDDEWLPEKLEKQLKLFQKFPHLGFVSSNALIVNKEGMVIKEIKLPKNSRFFLKNLLRRNFIVSLSSVMIKKEIFEKTGLLDEYFHVSADWDMWLRIIKNFEFDFVNEPLLKYYLYKDSFSRSAKYIDIAKEGEYLLNKHEELIKQNSKIWGEHLRHLGTLFLLAGENSKANKYFLLSIKIYPSFRNLVTYFLSFFGKDIYRFFLSAKKKIMRDPF